MNIIKFSRLPQNYFKIKSDSIYSNVKIISFKVSPKNVLFLNADYLTLTNTPPA